MTVITFLFNLSIFLLVYTYVIYPIFLFLLDKLINKKAYVESDIQPAVSIVIAAYNEEKVIRGRIENCLSLDYPHELLEIIVASDGSDDQTNAIMQEYREKGVVLRAFKDRQGKVNVLNQTVPQAQNEIIVFSDANSMFARDAVKKIVKPFADERVGCVCGGLHFVSAQGSRTGELEGFYWKYETFMKRIEGRRGALLGANGAIYAIRKKHFTPCEPDTIIEDFVLPMRILQKGHLVVYEPDAVAIEEAAKHIIQEKERRVRIGAGDYQALFRLIEMLNPLHGFSSLAFFSHKVLRWLAPFLLVAAFITNMFLLKNPLYLSIFLIQCVFYLSAVFGQILSWSGIYAKFFSLCYYFVSMNLALLLGFVRYVSNQQKVTWQRTER